MSGLFKKGLIFCTFLVACAAAALLLAGLGTKYWIQAGAKRAKNPLESDGRVHFGLFEGKKELNVAYGWRTYDIDVINTMKYEPKFLNYWFWIGTVAGLCLGLFFSLLAAVFAVINTATTTHRYLAGLSGLILWNFITFISSLCGIGLWVAQYYTTIQYNVLTREDRDNEWTSEGMAELSYSFWFVVGGACAACVNIIIVVISTSEKETETIIPVLEEKTNGAIMLY